MWHLDCVSGPFGVSQTQKFKHPDLHDEDIPEVDSSSPFQTDLVSGDASNVNVPFLITGDQNAGKSTFLHACVDANSPGFTQFSSFIPTVTSFFSNTRLSSAPEFESEKERIKWSRDEGYLLDTDIGRSSLVMSGGDFLFLLDELELPFELPKNFPIFGSLEVIELGGDFLDRVFQNSLDTQMANGLSGGTKFGQQLSAERFDEIYSSTLQLISTLQVYGFVYFVNLKTFCIDDFARRVKTLKSYFKNWRIPLTVLVSRVESENLADRIPLNLKSMKSPWKESFQATIKILQEEQSTYNVVEEFYQTERFNQVKIEIEDFLKQNDQLQFEVIPIQLFDAGINGDSMSTEERAAQGCSPEAIFTVWNCLLYCHMPPDLSDRETVDTSGLAAWVLEALDAILVNVHQDSKRDSALDSKVPLYVPVAAMRMLALEEEEFAFRSLYFQGLESKPVAALYASTSQRAYRWLVETGSILIGSKKRLKNDWVFCPSAWTVHINDATTSPATTTIEKSNNNWLIRLPESATLWEAIVSAFRRATKTGFEINRIKLNENESRNVEEVLKQRQVVDFEFVLDTLQWMILVEMPSWKSDVVSFSIKGSTLSCDVHK